MFRRIRTSLALLTALAMTRLGDDHHDERRSGCCYLGSRSACSDHYV